MANETTQNKNSTQVDATAQKLAAALEQPISAPAAATNVASKNVVKIAQPAKKAVAKKVAVKKPAAAKSKPAAKIAPKKPAAQQKVATTSSAAAINNFASKFNAAETAEKFKSAFEKIGNNDAAKLATAAQNELKTQLSDFAQKVYVQHTQLAKDMLAAKSTNQAFELQSKAAKQNLQQGLNQLLQIQQVCCESLSKSFALFSKK